MYTEVIDAAIKEKESLTKFQKALEQHQINAPKEALHVKYARGRFPQYYLVKNGKEVFLRKYEEDIARKIAQRDYESDMIALASKRIRALERLIKTFDSTPLDGPYCKMTKGKKILLDPLILDDQAYVDQWRAQFQTGQNDYELINPVRTGRGELVRSKSEKIIADFLDKYHIPYVYEPTLVLQNGHRIFPDFAILNVQKRQTYYLEHFGMMDNPEYSMKAVKKINEYASNGYVMGKNLLYLLEARDQAIDAVTLEQTIKAYFL